MASGYLVLETGETFAGEWRGGKEKAGEVVFNTSHSGYEEMATDPSYFRQILVLTAPMQGNYGVDKQWWESKQLWIHGFVSLQIQKSARDQAWKQRLEDAGIPILTDLDTRRLVLRLREMGTPWGAIVQASTEKIAIEKSKSLISEIKTQALQKDRDWAFAVSRKSSEIFVGSHPSGPRVAVLDFGCKENILRELLSRSREVKIFPSRTSAEEIKSWKPEGILLSNGPGDPADVEVAVETIRQLLGWKPIFGICMGHQLLALALGAKTYKLKFGHRGANHPIQDHLLNRIYMTSQNHGYAVVTESLPKTTVVTHVNLNDETVAGIRDQTQKCFGVQFHPESHPGPHDSEGLFDFFIKQVQ